MKKESIIVLCSCLLVILLLGVIAPSGHPGSNFDWVLAMTVISAVLMLRQERVIRVVFFCILCLLLFSLRNEKEANTKFLTKLTEKRIKSLEENHSEAAK